MKTIIKSLFVITLVAGVTIGATRAFFTDEETSTGNTFAAGAIDLKLDNSSYISDGLDENGNFKMVKSADTSWGESEPIDLTNEVFFNFHDLKPGDLGEDTISLHVNDNEAWACLDLKVDVNSDVDCTDPELAVDTQCVANDDTNGDLADQLQFMFWRDDGDNVLEEGEQLLTTNPYTVAQMDGAKWKLADSNADEIGIPAVATDPLLPNQTYYIGKAWCFGTISEPASRISQGENTGPDVRGPGVKCDGSNVNNAAQTDLVEGTLTFTAYQYRNNETFTCSQGT